MIFDLIKWRVCILYVIIRTWSCLFDLCFLIQNVEEEERKEILAVKLIILQGKFLLASRSS